MGIDLTDRRDLDWLARGRAGDVPHSAFEDVDAADERDRILDAIEAELAERDDSRDFTEEELATAAMGVIVGVGPETVDRIQERTWSNLDDVPESEFVDRYVEAVASRLVDRYDEVRRDSTTGSDSRDSSCRPATGGSHGLSPN